MTLFRKRIRSLTAIFLIVLIFTAVYLKSVADSKRAVKETAFGDLDISNVPDGIYAGEYDMDFVYAKVEVTWATNSSTVIKEAPFSVNSIVPFLLCL